MVDKLVGRQITKDKAFKYKEVYYKLLVWLKKKGLINQRRRKVGKGHPLILDVFLDK